MNQFEPLLEKLGRGQKRCPSCLGVAAARAFACPHCAVTFPSTLSRRRRRDEDNDESIARVTRKKQISFKKMFQSSDSEDNETSDFEQDDDMNEKRSKESSEMKNKRKLEHIDRNQSHEEGKNEDEHLHMTPSRRGRKVILSDSEDSSSSFASDMLSDNSADLVEHTPPSGKRKHRKRSRLSRHSQLGPAVSTQPTADESLADVSVIEECAVDVSTTSVEATDGISLSVSAAAAVTTLHLQAETAPISVQTDRLTPGHKRCPQCQKILAVRCSRCSQCEHRFEPKAKVPRPKKEPIHTDAPPLSLESSPQSDTRVRRARAKPPKRFTELLPDEERMLQQALRNSQTDVSRNVQKPLKDLLPSAPTYHPTEEEFADPFAYFRKIRSEAARFGICKIVPPNGWKPPLFLNEQTFRFTVRSQIINELLQGKKFNFSKNYYSIPMFKEYADEFKAKWLAKMGVDINSVNDEAIEMEYWRLVETNPEAVQVLYGADIDTVHTGSAFPRPKRKATDRDIQTPAPSAAAPFPWIQPFPAANGSPQVSTSSLPTPIRSASSGLTVGTHTLPTASVLVAPANDHVPTAAVAADDMFANLRVPAVLAFTSSSEQSGSSATSSPERLVEVVHAQVSAPTPASSASAQPCTNQVPFATPHHNECPNRADFTSEAERYAHSPWNLNNMPFHKSSLLRFLGEEISGITAPWLYVGMLFSTFCWHNEDHYLYSINYMHKGASKTWYGVPGDEAASFERVLKGTVMELWNSRKELLSELVTMLSPALLHKNKVSVCRLVQNAGEFVLTFPQAYHAGFSHGFNIAEAVNIAPEDWIPYGRYAMDRYVASRGKGRIPVFPYEKLIFRACERSSQLDLSGQQSVIAELELMYKLEQEIYEALHKQSLMFSEPAAKLQSATDEASMRAADAALKEAYGLTGGVNWELSAVLMPTSQMNNVTMNMDMSQHMHLGVRLRLGMVNLGGLTTLNGSEDDFKCESCQSLNFLSAVTCPLHKQTMCLSHANLLCTDQPKVEGKRCVSKKILYYRYSLDSLLATISRAKSLWRWNKSLAANIRVCGASGGSLESATSNELEDKLAAAATSATAQQPIDTVPSLACASSSCTVDVLASSVAENLQTVRDEIKREL